MPEDKTYKPKHMLVEPEHKETEPPETASVFGIPSPDMGSEAEFVPIPGDTRVGHIAPNGAVIHDPCSDLPEVKPDNEYTPEKEDLNLLQM